MLTTKLSTTKEGYASIDERPAGRLIRVFTPSVIAFSIAISFFPLLFNLPFRDNIYLTWEGAYRLANGQIPFTDFFMPFGYGYFILPALFFKVFGPGMKVLLFTQAVMNTILLLTFYRLLLLFDLKKEIVFLSTIVMGLSYTFLFFWPWYNHAAFFYNLVALTFCMAAILKEKRQIFYSACAGIFAFLSFFTKQDYGSLAILSIAGLFTIDLFFTGKFKNIASYIVALAGTAVLCIAPVYNSNFTYWFNLGQPPHQSRLQIGNFLNEFFAGSEWEKFAILLLVLLVVSKYQAIIKDKKRLYFYLLVLIILGETLVTKVTSRLPKDTTTYFWGFLFAFILSELYPYLNLRKIQNVAIAVFLVSLLFSQKYWSYANRLLNFKSSGTNLKADAGYKWKASPQSSFKGIYLPEPTISGIEKILSLNLPENATVLNLSELTMLAEQIPYEPIKSLPLWYHLNIGIFQPQVDSIKMEIVKESYDLVLFEDIPNLDNFYPYSLQEQLKQSYQLIERFPAPRKEDNAFIEVYVKK